jgi:hypothetical protein
MVKCCKAVSDQRFIRAYKLVFESACNCVKAYCTKLVRALYSTSRQRFFSAHRYQIAKYDFELSNNSIDVCGLRVFCMDTLVAPLVGRDGNRFYYKFVSSIDLVLIDQQSVGKRSLHLIDIVYARKRWTTIYWRVNNF